MSKNLETTKEKLEVKVRLVDAPAIENFNEKDSIITFDITNEVPLEMKSNVIKIVSESTKEQLEQIAPFIQKVFSLQEIYFAKYNPEDKDNSIQQYKDFKKIVTAKAIDEAFDPIYREVMNRKEEIVNMKKAFKEDLKNKMILLDENFSEYLKEEAEKKAKAEAKKNAAAEAAKAENEAKMKQLEENNKNQEIEKSILSSQNKIGQINIAVTSGLDNLSLEGLKKQADLIASYEFKDFKPDHAEVPDEKITEITQYFENVIKSSLSIINTKISQLNLQTENKDIKNENQVLNAQVPSSLEQQQTPNNFQQTPQQQQVVNNQQTTPQPTHSSFPVQQPADDYNKMILLKSMFENYTESIKQQNEQFIKDVKAISGEMQQKTLKDFLDKFTDNSAPQITDWMEKTMPWFMKGYTAFENFIKSNNK